MWAFGIWQTKCPSNRKWVVEFFFHISSGLMPTEVAIFNIKSRFALLWEKSFTMWLPACLRPKAECRLVTYNLSTDSFAMPFKDIVRRLHFFDWKDINCYQEMVSLIALKVFTSKPCTCQLHKSTALFKKLPINIFLCRIENHAWNNDKNVELCKFYAAFVKKAQLHLYTLHFRQNCF